MYTKSRLQPNFQLYYTTCKVIFTIPTFRKYKISVILEQCPRKGLYILNLTTTVKHIGDYCCLLLRVFLFVLLNGNN